MIVEEINNVVTAKTDYFSVDALETVAMNLLTGIITVITSIPNAITYSIITLLAIIFICFSTSYNYRRIMLIIHF